MMTKSCMRAFITHGLLCFIATVLLIYGVSAQTVPAGVPQTWSPTVDYRGVLIDRYQPNSIRVVGIYKVSGSPYLLARPVKSNVFSTNGVGYNVMTAYDTYDQKLEIFVGPIDLEKILIKNLNEIDSFTLMKDSLKANDLNFINTKVLGDKKGFFLQKLHTGKKYALYKEYRSVLENSTTDALIGDARIFVPKTFYYYTSPDSKKIKKIQANRNALKKEFAGNTNIIPLVESGDFVNDTDRALINVFLKLDEQ